MAVDTLYLPPEWTDDKIMAVMFAPFRDRSLNPTSWDRKMKFWLHVINEDCRKNNHFIIDVKELSARFIRQGKKPACLDVVLSEMKRSGTLKGVSRYVDAGARDWVGWGLDTFVWTPVQWSLGALWGKSDDRAEQLLLPGLLKDAGDRLLKFFDDKLEPDSTSLMAWDTLKTIAQRAGLTSDQECDLVLQHLQRSRKMKVGTTEEKDIVVKFCKKGDSYVSPITDVELNVFRIQKVLNNLERQTEVLSHQSDLYIEDARRLVKDGRRTQALHLLRRKRRLEQTLHRKMSAIDQLHDMLSKIQEAATNKMILHTYESALEVIVSLNEDTSVDQVEDVMDKLHDGLEEQSEVSKMLAPDVGDSLRGDLEAELADLMSAERQATSDEDSRLADLLASLHVTNTVPALPEVPTFSPSKSPERETTLPKVPAMAN